MAYTEEVGGQTSVPPPGWSPPGGQPVMPASAAAPAAPTRMPVVLPAVAAPVAVSSPIAVAAGVVSPMPSVAGATPQDAAVRWRIRAATFDNLIVYGGY